MKKIVQIILVACFLCQSPVRLRADRLERGPQISADNSDWKLFGGVVLVWLAVWSVMYMTTYFSGSGQAPSQSGTSPTPGKIFTVTENGVVPGNLSEEQIVALEEPIELKKPVGFKNSNNDCYLNALLTILFSSREFIDFLHEHAQEVFELLTDDKCFDSKIEPYLKAELGLENRQATRIERGAWNRLRRRTIKDKKIDRGIDRDKGLVQKILLVELYVLANRIARKAGPYNGPVKMCVERLGNFVKGDAADCGEAATHIFDALERVKSKKGHIPPFKKLLGFTVCRTSKCPDCTAKQTEKTHPYIDLLGLPVHNKTNSVVKLDTLLTDTVLDSCSICKNKNCKITKKSVKSGKEPPKLLFYMFNRNYYDQEKKCFVRNSLKIEIPDNVTFTDNKQQKKKTTYRLYGIIQHDQDKNFAHYTSLVRVGSQWYDCDDLLNTVRVVEKNKIDKIVTPTAKTKMGTILPVGVIYRQIEN